MVPAFCWRAMRQVSGAELAVDGGLTARRHSISGVLPRVETVSFVCNQGPSDTARDCDEERPNSPDKL
jgi:hypothetical protein